MTPQPIESPRQASSSSGTHRPTAGEFSIRATVAHSAPLPPEQATELQSPHRVVRGWNRTSGWITRHLHPNRPASGPEADWISEALTDRAKARLLEITQGNDWLTISPDHPRLVADVAKFDDFYVTRKQTYLTHLRGSMYKLQYRFPSGEKSTVIFRNRVPQVELAYRVLDEKLGAGVTVPTFFAIHDGQPGVVMEYLEKAHHPYHPSRAGLPFAHRRIGDDDITSRRAGQSLLRMASIRNQAERTAEDEQFLKEHEHLERYDVPAWHMERGRVIADHRVPRFRLTDPLAKEQLIWLALLTKLFNVHDRGPNNMMVEVERRTGVTSQVWGIDNEGGLRRSAPEPGPEVQPSTTAPNGYHLFELDALDVVTTEQFERIQSVAPQDYDDWFTGILDRPRIDMAKAWLAKLQRDLREPGVRVVPRDELANVQFLDPRTSYVARDGDPHGLLERARTRR